MALSYAIASGNWSSTSTWNGSVLPGSTDTVCANGFTVTIDSGVGSTLTTGTLTTAANSPAVAGGGFTTALASLTLNAGVLAGTTACLAYTGTGTLTIGGTITGGSAAASYGVNNSSTGTVAIAGTVTGGSNGTSYGVYNASTGNISVTGLVIASANGAGVYNNSSGAVTVAGNVVGSSGNNAGIQNNAGGTVAVTGNVTGGAYALAGGYGIYSSSATGGAITVAGNVNPGSGLNSVGIRNNSTASGVAVTGSVFANANGTPGVFSRVLTISNSQSFQVAMPNNAGTFTYYANTLPSITSAFWGQVIDGGVAAGNFLRDLLAVAVGSASVSGSVTSYQSQGGTTVATVTTGSVSGQRTASTIS